MRYEILLFDADDTLFDFQQSEREAFLRTLRTFGIDSGACGPDGIEGSGLLGIYRRINEALWKAFERGETTQAVLKVERFRQLGAALEANFDPQVFADAYEETLGNTCILLAGAEDLVRRLARTHRMAIVTNGLKRVQENRIVRAPIADCFKTVVISEAVGVSKPDAAIFGLTLDRLGHADRRTVLMVGDSLASDIRGGRNAGIDTCWYNPRGHEAGDADRPTHEIRVLQDLLALPGMEGASRE